MVSGLSAGTSVYTGSLAEGVQQSCTGVACSNPELITQLILFVGAGLLTVAVAVTLTYLSKANDTCERERACIVDERDAFVAFRDRLSSISASTGSIASEATGGGVLTQTRVRDESLRQVRVAYRETVMSVSHYESSYDESLATHMSEELGTDLARAVVSGHSFSPPVKRALLTAVDSAVDRRDLIVQAIDTELADIASVRCQLDAIERERESLQTDVSPGAYHLLEDRYGHIQHLESRVDRVLADRQQRLRDGVAVGKRRRSADEFHEYIYDDVDARYPILAEGVALAKRLERDRHSVLDRLTRIV